MPKKLVIKTTPGNSISPVSSAYNAANALAEAIGSSVTQGTETGSFGEAYQVSFSSVGYPDLHFSISSRMISSYNMPVGIFSKTSGVQLDTTNRITLIVNNTGSQETLLTDNAMSCYVVRDPNNDTIIAHFHSGETDYAKAGKDVEKCYLSIFIGKDINGEVVWGIGNGSIKIITNGSRKIDLSGSDVSCAHPMISDYGGPYDVLHFVKMRNYLSDGYPEMKTAYATVTRASKAGNRGNLSFYADGALWGYGGWGNYNSAVYEIDPWVKY